MRVFIGVDPGVKGGIGQVSEDGLFRCWDMQTTEKDLWDIFQEDHNLGWVDHPELGWLKCEMMAVIEEVHSMPKQGVVSTFTFGRSYGLLRGFLWASGMSFHKVNPKKWQRALGMNRKPKEEDKHFKHRLRELAQGLAPNCKVTLATADAILLAEYLRRCELGIV